MPIKSDRFKEPPRLQPHAHHWKKLIGQKFGKLTALGYAGAMTRYGQKKICCYCECGFYVNVMANYLRSGNTTSCGCAFSEMIAKRNVESMKHGRARIPAGEKRLPALYRTWLQIKQRCFSVKHAAYPDYGGRGITLYEPWRKDYAAFERDIEAEIGPKPQRMSIDRINNDGNYEPGNLRWATQTEQNRNRRVTIFMELNGERRPLAEWADLAGIRQSTVSQRVSVYGWPLDEALGTPTGAGRCPLEDRVKWTSTESYRLRSVV